MGVGRAQRTSGHVVMKMRLRRGRRIGRAALVFRHSWLFNGCCGFEPLPSSTSNLVDGLAEGTAHFFVGFKQVAMCGAAVEIPTRCGIEAEKAFFTG